MSDPRKNFICPTCGLVINDMQREWGADTPCPRCVELKWIKEMEAKHAKKRAD